MVIFDVLWPSATEITIFITSTFEITPVWPDKLWLYCITVTWLGLVIIADVQFAASEMNYMLHSLAVVNRLPWHKALYLIHWPKISIS